MLNKNIIKKFTALFLLGVFLLGITPKKFLHSLFAAHRDYASHIIDGSTEQVTKAGYNCNCDNLVADSPFTTTVSYFSFSNIPLYNSFVVYSIKAVVTSPLLLANLRGPPVKL